MSGIEPKPLHPEDHSLFELLAARESESTELAAVWAHVLWLEQREAHVVETLREAQRNNGGYGFVRSLLEYLGATEEVPA